MKTFLTILFIWFLFTVLWFLATLVSVAHADTIAPDPILSQVATAIAGQPEYVLCDLTVPGLDGQTSMTVTAGQTYFTGDTIEITSDECNNLLVTHSKESWQFAGMAAEVIGHEAAHDMGFCSDTYADYLGTVWVPRIVNMTKALEGIRVKPKQRNWAMVGAWNRAKGFYGPDKVYPNYCRDQGLAVNP